MKLSILSPYRLPLLLLAACGLANCPSANAQQTSIPFGGNAFQISPKSREEITDNGIETWKSKHTEYALYFSLHSVNSVQLVLPLVEQSSNSTLSISVNGAVKEYNVKAGDQEIVPTAGPPALLNGRGAALNHQAHQECHAGIQRHEIARP